MRISVDIRELCGFEQVISFHGLESNRYTALFMYYNQIVSLTLGPT